VNRKVFAVTIAQMLRDGHLAARQATQAVRAANPGVRRVYGPGRVPVEERAWQRAPRKLVGFMELKRQREARARRVAE
jgi:hypothetical protein